MKTLIRLVVPLVLALCLPIPTVNAHPDKHHEYRNDFGDRHSDLNRVHRGYRESLEKRHYRPRTERGRKYYKNLVEERRKRRHGYDHTYRARTSHAPARNGHYYHDGGGFRSIALDVTFIH